ncbi:Clavaminate synthase-like protein [Xylariaceae sp. FL1019]|nr:Clavaminate synthase-like protein [Xylariaceae sp. FL1019]
MVEQIPVIDLAPYFRAGPSAVESHHVAELIHQAASTWGFFMITNTPVDPETQSVLASTTRAFFDLPEETKLALDVRAGGPAWRGYMPLGGEHTHGSLDWKEGLYVGPEHADVTHSSAYHCKGRINFPTMPFRRCDMQHLFFCLGLDHNGLRQKLLEPEPVTLFRCFKYAPSKEKPALENGEEGYGIGEHTDFGYLTILKMESPGLRVNTRNA